MQLDIKNLQQQDMSQLVKSLELVSSRLLECITKNSQTACSTTPEIQALFDQWIELIGDRILQETGDKGEIKPAELALEIGISADSVVSLLLALQRQGKVRIDKIKVSATNGDNHEICACIK